MTNHTDSGTPRMNAPERIYLQYESDDCTWCRDQVCDDDTAYIRADIAERENADLRQQLAPERRRVVEECAKVCDPGPMSAAEYARIDNDVIRHDIDLERSLAAHLAAAIRALAEPQQSATGEKP